MVLQCAIFDWLLILSAADHVRITVATGCTILCWKVLIRLSSYAQTYKLFLQVLKFIERHTQSMEIEGGMEFKAHLAGNSIYVDRAFLQRYMPRIHAHLHWRLIDVSTLLELARRWFPKEFSAAPRKRVSPDPLLLSFGLASSSKETAFPDAMYWRRRDHN